MIALSRDPNDAAAEAIVSKDRTYHSMLRTTCVATLLEGATLLMLYRSALRPM